MTGRRANRRITPAKLEIAIGVLAAVKDARGPNMDPEMQHGFRLAIDELEQIADAGGMTIGPDGAEVVKPAT